MMLKHLTDSERFSHCGRILRQHPEQACRRKEVQHRREENFRSGRKKFFLQSGKIRKPSGNFLFQGFGYMNEGFRYISEAFVFISDGFG
ncbi:hypothetical protein [Porphyromonas gulae]|uniref:hypothetical protein n=1 Tax=Porphyromonas gulae TaxID=111105 RepID=UPI0009B8809B|nr:hypothetical protein [Porphyromonas gulae]